MVVLVHDLSLQLVWLEKSQGLHGSMNSILQLVDSLRPDELIWLHAYMTGRVHALSDSPTNVWSANRHTVQGV